ncbi:hypothetical protein GN316_19305 [Xylophilus sp. Kf1]|nr:hypothetical protein [Xylophilus sp. Kf1]
MDTQMLKVFAERLRAHLEQHQLHLKHGQALDLIAALPGLRNWPEVNAFPVRVAAGQLNDSSAERLSRRLAKIHGVSLTPVQLLQILKPARVEGDRVLAYEEMDNSGSPTGRRAAFAGVEFTPLRYADLVDKKLSDKVVIPLNWKHAKVIESNIPEIELDKFASGNATIESTYTSKSIGLVKGGWLPSGLAVRQDMIVLPDRCTITELKGRFCDGVKKNSDDKDFLDFFEGEGIRINPLLYALEGNLRRNPTPHEIKQQLEEVSAALRIALPKAELVPGDGGLQGVVGIVQDTLASTEQKQTFLMRMAPKLQPPTSASKKAQLWDEALAVAQECGIQKKSLVVLAVLSSISVPMGNSPAKRLLKPSLNYSAEDAYNALADLRSLEMLLCLFGLFPYQRIMLCTGDKNLALFWAGIRASNFAWAGKAATFTLSPVEAFLPNVSTERGASFFDSLEPRGEVAVEPSTEGGTL